jgi:hypothetical protein
MRGRLTQSGGLVDTIILELVFNLALWLTFVC